MKEKIIVGVLVVGIAVAGALVVLRRNDLEKTKGSAPISDETGSVTAGRSSAGGSSAATAPVDIAAPGTLGSISADMQLVSVVYPRNVDAAVARWDATRQNFASTAVWKKLNLGAQLEQKFHEGFQQGVQKNPGSPTPEQIEAEWAKFAEKWRSVNEILTAIAVKSTPVKVEGHEIPVPAVLVQLTFESPEAAKATYSDIQAQLLPDKDRLESPAVTAVKRSNGNGIDFTLRGPDTDQALSGALEVDGNKLRATVGGTAADFFTTDSTHRLVQASNWAPGIKPDGSAALGYADMSRILTTVDKIVAAIPPDKFPPGESAESVNKSLEFYRQFQTAWFGVNLEEGVNMTSCVRPSPGSSYELMLNKLASGDSDKSKSGHKIASLIDSQTIFALDYSTDAVQAAGQSAIDQIRSALMSSKGPGENKEILEFVDAVTRGLAKVKAKEFGAFVSPPFMPPIIGAGVYIGGSDLKGDELMTQLAAAINEISQSAEKAAGNPPGGEIAHAGKSPDGKPQLKLTVGGLQLVGGLAGDNSVIISIDNSIVETMARRIEKGVNYFDKFQRPAGLGTTIAAADYFVYISTGTLIDIGRNFLPLLLAQQPQEPKIEMADADEILNLLKFSYVTFQRAYPEGKMFCSESKGYVLE